MPTHAVNPEGAEPSSTGPVMDVVLCWHMHQPDYRLEGRYLKPWTWLHAVKDYSDMAAHLETSSGGRAVVNFSPVLIEQLRDYPHRIRAFLHKGEPMRDLVLDALGGCYEHDEHELVAQLMRVNLKHMKRRFPAYSMLYDKAWAALNGGEALDSTELDDLVVWYVITWLGESLRGDPLVGELMEAGSGFTQENRRSLIAWLGKVIDGILPRYRKLAEKGVVELSVTPYAHPILPLLLDIESAREAVPDATLPEEGPEGGEQRCHWHLGEARRVFVEAFGFEPAGCWPSEGALSQEALGILARHGFHWTASGSQVLRNTLEAANAFTSGLPQLRAWRAEDSGLACFFRDDGLSDLIGFEYSKWPAEKAVDDFLSRLEALRDRAAETGETSPVINIIMDGENAWEYYPENGGDFLKGLYAGLSGHPGFRLSTFAELLARADMHALPTLCAGSWVHGNLSTWVGETAKNHAWKLLAQAQGAAKAAIDSGEFNAAQEWAILRQLAVCEASDWFWWLGGDAAPEDAVVFDGLFRRQLQVLYRMVGQAPPDSLERPIAEAVDSAAGGDKIVGAMRRSN